MSPMWLTAHRSAKESCSSVTNADCLHGGGCCYLDTGPGAAVGFALVLVSCGRAQVTFLIAAAPAMARLLHTTMALLLQQPVPQHLPLQVFPLLCYFNSISWLPFPCIASALHMLLQFSFPHNSMFSSLQQAHFSPASAGLWSVLCGAALRGLLYFACSDFCTETQQMMQVG